MADKPLRIGIIAGESSGDILAAGLIRQIRARYPNAIIEGIAGPNMLKAGCRTLFDMEELSVMGLVEVMSRIRRLLHIRKTVREYFLNNRPEVFIGVDAPDFNLKLEKVFKQHGIKTVHYVSPTVWAWRENRIFGIGEATNLVLSIFPFEKAIYERHGFPCEYVGHTMADDIPLQPDQQQARQSLALDFLSAEQKVLAILPGSRGAEVNMLLHIFLQTAQKLAAQVKNLKVIIPAANAARKRQIEVMVSQFMQSLADDQSFTVDILDGEARNAMIASDAVLLASGTASLEAMLCKKPMVVAYRLKWFTHQMMKVLYKAKYFALPNLLANKKVVPELLQEDVNPDTLAEYLLPMLQGQAQETMDKFTELHQILRQGADEKSALAVLDLIHVNK
jgi:lipid-A-disaccharide synthase